MPLRLSIMVPISNRRLQIFDSEIIEIMKFFIKQNYTIEKHADLIIQQEQEFWNSRSPEQFKFKLYQIALEAYTGCYPERILKPGELSRILETSLQIQDQSGRNRIEEEAKN